MILKYVSDYLSIKQFDDILLNDFAVITGVNGAGKSHFLNAIDNGKIQIEGIDNENIIMYNYNDFNVVDIDFNQNNNHSPELLNKRQLFQNKSSAASQKYSDKRNQILDSFNIERYYSSFYLDDDFINNINQFGILDWNEEDKQYYAKFDLNNPDTTNVDYNKFVLFQSYISRYQHYKIEDIENFIKFLIDRVPKIHAFNIIRNLGYNKELKNINHDLCKEVFEEFKKNPQFDFWSEVNRRAYPTIILDILGHLASQNYIYKINLLEFLSILNKLYKEIEVHFKTKMDEEFFKQIHDIKGENILDNISFENGFFNINDIAKEEKNFQLNKKQNDVNRYLKSEGQNVHAYSDEELTNLFGDSPIKILNSVLNEYDVNGYEFKNSELTLDIHNGMQNQNVHVYLYNKNGNFETQLNSLSSGEKTLLALAFSVYKLKKDKVLAKVLLMDELDSALHPSMSKRLINVLHNYFYKTLGIKIIISSHSPSTIAFSPDESLYIIKKDDIKKIYQVSKDQALKELTVGVPSFSINYENRRQVFVESKYDVEYYGSLYSIFQNKLDKEISLNFIASGDVRKNNTGQGSSSCDVVKSVAKKLRDAGNNSIYGIIDWDLAKSKDINSYIITLGCNSRYSIENYILDPLLIGILLIIEKIEKPQYFDLREDFRILDLFSISTLECQKIIDKIEQDFTDKSIIITSSKKEYEIISGEKLSISKEIAEIKGHELEEKYFIIYPKLGRFKGSADNYFKNFVIKKVFDDFTNYIPIDLLHVLMDAQK